MPPKSQPLRGAEIHLEIVLDLLVLTYGRAEYRRQHTIKALMNEGLTPTLVVQYREKDKYSWWAGPLHVLPSEIETISPTRDYLIHHPKWKSDKVVMLDDDLLFFARREDDRTKFRDLRTGELRAMFSAIEGQLETHPHVGISPREGGNRNTEEVLYNTRMMRVLAYNRRVLKEAGVIFQPMQVMEDFHCSLQLLKLGYDTVLLNNWCNNQAEGSGASGGCSTFRTMELHAQNAELLAKLHAPYVKVVKKQTKGAWGGGERTDVVISWKRARQHEA